MMSGGFGIGFGIATHAPMREIIMPKSVPMSSISPSNPTGIGIGIAEEDEDVTLLDPVVLEAVVVDPDNPGAAVVEGEVSIEEETDV